MINSEVRDFIENINKDLGFPEYAIYIFIVLFILLIVIFFYLLKKVFESDDSVFEIDFTKEIEIRVTESGEVIETSLVLLPLDDGIEITDITYNLTKENNPKEILIKPSNFIHNIGNLDASFQKVDTTSPVILLSPKFIDRVECIAVINEGLKIRSNFENFEFDIHNYGRNASKEAEFYGNIDEDYVRKSFLSIKNAYLERILNSLILDDGKFNLTIDISFRILNLFGKRSKNIETLSKSIEFSVKDYKKILKPRIDDMLNRKLLNILTSPEAPKEIITPTYIPINTRAL